MGIKYLNSYLQRNCSDSIVCLHLSQLSGKKIVIDVSIYLYKYEYIFVLFSSYKIKKDKTFFL